MRSNADTFENVQPVLHAKVPIIRSRHRKLHIEIDISLHNMLVIIPFHPLLNFENSYFFRRLKIRVC
jgi:DNA polymerase sigma